MSKRPRQTPESGNLTSSTPATLPKKQETFFHDVLTILEEKNVPFAVAGAFALQHHAGICRETKDLDIFLSAEETPHALAALQHHGFKCEVTDPVWLAKAYRDNYFIDLITGMSNAVIVVDASWIKHAHPAEVFGVQTRLLAPEEILVSRLFVIRRERFDGADIAHIIYAVRGKLDWKRILHHVGDHWEILLWALLLFRYVYPAHSDYVPASLWHDLLDRTSKSISRPDPRQEFRGSLVDECMFAIDVEDWGLPNILERYRAERAPMITFPTDTMR
jgi:hypothetical protein